jgi:nucleoid DNA-binding protein
MRLSTYIKDLLYRYECVIVPGFGAFLSRHRSAMIDTGSQIFHPPGKVISFNRQLQTNDGILANHVAACEDCPYEVALQRIRHFTGELSLKLAEGELVELPQVGAFELNREGKVQFEPDPQMNFSTAAFGLSSITTLPVVRGAEKVVEMRQESDEMVRSINFGPVLRYAAVGIIALMAGGFGGMKWYEGQVKEHNFAQRQEADKRIVNEIQEATFVIDEHLPLTEVTVSPNTGRYHIIAGAFRIEENAHKKVQQLADKGFPARYIGANRYGLHQVVYQSFEDRSEALKILRQIQQGDNKDAWLLVQQLNP